MDDREVEQMLASFRLTGDDALRNRVVEDHRWLAVACAKRFRGRGEPLDDLVQVASLGILKAADRFDADRGVRFRTYAAVTARGELRRHFRDRTWSLKVPRPVKDLYQDVKHATEELGQGLQRTPAAAEVAAHLGIGTDAVVEALGAAAAYRPVADDTTDLGALGAPDAALERVEDMQLLRHALDGLPERERRVVHLRFFAECTQDEIARDLGCSQVHVSRLLRRTLDRVGAHLAAAGGGPDLAAAS